MKDTWHRAGVYLGLREDPGREARWDADRPAVKTRLLTVPLALAALIAVFSAAILAIRLIAGGDTTFASVLWGGTRLFFAVAGTWALLAGIVRWGRWLWAPKRSS